jgi:tetratricopeptide (TPR) repeat protein
MVIHGIGTLADGKEFWNTRTDGSPYEYTLGVDSVIRGFSEGMRQVREGDRIIITMKPELAYGARERTGIPANSTLVFDYEILAVKPLSFVRLMRDAIAAGTVDEAIAKAKATPNLKDHYVSASSIQAAASAANRKEAGTNEKVLALGLTLLPSAYQLHQALGRLQANRGDKPAAINSYEAALKLNPKKTPTEIRDHETATTARSALLPQDHQATHQRGAHVMGFDQDKTVHHFLLFEDGGAIDIVVKDPADTANRDAIRAHLPHIAMMFGQGNFEAPMLVHETKAVPGIQTLTARKDAIAYRYVETPAGGRVDVVTKDAQALQALHEFLRYQIKEHRTGDPGTVARRK